MLPSLLNTSAVPASRSRRRAHTTVRPSVASHPPSSPGAFLKPRALWWLLHGDYRATPDRNLSGLATPSRISLLVILGGIAMGGVLWIVGKGLS